MAQPVDLLVDRAQPGLVLRLDRHARQDPREAGGWGLVPSSFTASAMPSIRVSRVQALRRAGGPATSSDRPDSNWRSAAASSRSGRPSRRRCSRTAAMAVWVAAPAVGMSGTEMPRHFAQRRSCAKLRGCLPVSVMNARTASSSGSPRWTTFSGLASPARVSAASHVSLCLRRISSTWVSSGIARAATAEWRVPRLADKICSRARR